MATARPWWSRPRRTKAGEIAERFERFKTSGEPGPVKLTVYASWWLSWVLGGVMAFLCAFYLFGCAMAIGKALLGLTRKGNQNQRE